MRFLFPLPSQGNWWSALQRLGIQSHAVQTPFATALRVWVGLGTTKVSSKQGRFGSGQPGPTKKYGLRFLKKKIVNGTPPKNVENRSVRYQNPKPKETGPLRGNACIYNHNHNGHPRSIYPQTSSAGAALPTCHRFHMNTTSLLGEESMNMRESWEGTPLATKDPS